jgi:hypothetical protein
MISRARYVRTLFIGIAGTPMAAAFDVSDAVD